MLDRTFSARKRFDCKAGTKEGDCRDCQLRVRRQRREMVERIAARLKTEYDLKR